MRSKRLLLDECVPWPMGTALTGHSCTTAQRMGWGAITNGELIRLAEADFDVFVTSDQNIRYQQNLSGRRIAILELSTNDLRRILAASEQITTVLETIEPGAYLRIEIL